MLQYLGHVSKDTLAEAQQVSIAFDLAVAALVGDSVFNFTELVSPPLPFLATS